MLEKELAQATKMAESAHKKVDQLRKKLVSDSEKAHLKTRKKLMHW
jgi:colicin import membrane protein